MIDYGLFALIVVILVLVFLAFHAWRSIRAEADRISSQWTRIEARIAECERSVSGAHKHAQDALNLAQEVQGTHYKQLLKRIEEAETAAAASGKNVDNLLSKVATLGGRMSAIQRWMKNPAEAEADGGESQQVEVFPAASVPPPVNHSTGHFGRVLGRKGG